MQQDRLIGAAGDGSYEAFRAWAGRPEYGNSLLVRWMLVVVTHLHHEVDGAVERDDQTRQLIDWVSAAPVTDAQVVMGDFNANPAEPAVQRMRSHGYRSAYAEANGEDPPVTWPSGLQAPAIDTDGDPACLDYIWIRGGVRVVSARLAFDRPDPEDPGLLPSDHFGIAARLELGLRDGRWEVR